jgi:hypothetical protein
MRGHRMVVVGFQDKDGERRRVVVRDLVGGLGWEEQDVERMSPLDGKEDITDGYIAPPATTDQPESFKWTEADGQRLVKTIPNFQSSTGQSLGSAGHENEHTGKGPANTQPQMQSAKHEQFNFPPDGGIGVKVQARKAYWPGPESKDELAFPAYAEITEAMNVNGDWWWGVYAGKKGLFPGGYIGSRM